MARWDREAGQQAQGGAARRGPREQEPQGASRKVAPPTRALKAAGTPTRAKPMPRTARPPGGLGRWIGGGGGGGTGSQAKRNGREADAAAHKGSHTKGYRAG